MVYFLAIFLKLLQAYQWKLHFDYFQKSSTSK